MFVTDFGGARSTHHGVHNTRKALRFEVSALLTQIPKERRFFNMMAAWHTWGLAAPARPNDAPYRENEPTVAAVGALLGHYPQHEDDFAAWASSNASGQNATGRPDSDGVVTPEDDSRQGPSQAFWESLVSLVAPVSPYNKGAFALGACR